MTRTKKKSDRKRTLQIEWENQPDNCESHSPSPTLEEESKLFLEAIRSGKILEKDEMQGSQNSALVRSRKRINRYEVDLHGMTVETAQHYVINAIQDILVAAKGQVITIRVITGKGHRSKDRGPQLVHAIHHVVEARFKSRLISIEVSPHELKLGDSYFKGHFDLKIR